MTSRPLLIPLLGMIIGLTLSGLFDLTVPWWTGPTFVGLALGAVFAPSRHLFTFLLFLVGFSWGLTALRPYLHPEITTRSPAWYASEQDRIVEGIIMDRPDSTESGCRVVIRAERLFADGVEHAVDGMVLVVIRQGRTTWVTGDRVRFVAKLRLPRNLGLPGEFDYVRFLAYRDIHVTAHLAGADDLVLIRERVDFPVRNALDRLARRLGGFISDTLPVEEGGILRALLIGDRGYVSPAIETAYTRAGVNHILSISGFHVAIVALALNQLLFFLGRCSGWLMLRCNLRRLTLLAGLPALVFYLFLSGAAPATARSVVMIVLAVLALLMQRESEGINILIVSALALIAIRPPLIFDLSFQLSFLAVWGLIVLTPLFMAPFRRRDQGRLFSLLLIPAASLAAVCATLVPVAYYFHRTTATGVIANLIIVPLMGYGAVVTGLAALLLFFVTPALAGSLLSVAGFLICLSNRAIEALAQIPLLPPWAPTRVDFFLFLLMMAGLTFLRGPRLKCVTAALVTSVIVLGHLTTLRAEPELQLAFFSMGQAESTLIRFPGGESVLVDGGGSLREGGADTGERLLAPALRSLGVARIDTMILTHPHPDHMKGLTYIVENFPVGRFLETGCHEDLPEYGQLRDAIRRHGIPVVRVTAMTPSLPVGDGTMEFLAPWPNDSERDDVNDDSLVFRLRWRELAVLFTGDIGVTTEARLLEHPERLRAQILKVAHHGSRYSSSGAFLDAIRPRTALIAAGFGNTFHLPAADTLRRLSRRRITVYRTDLDGTIFVTSTGSGFSVTSLPPRT